MISVSATMEKPTPSSPSFDDGLRLRAIAAEIRQQWDHLPANVLDLFFAIAQADTRHEPMTITEAGEAVGMSLAASSRNVLLLEARRADRGLEPLNLVEIKPHPTDYRRKLVTLSPKGRALYARLCKLVRP